MKRRQALKFIAVGAAAATAGEAEDAGHAARGQPGAAKDSPYKPRYFSEHEFAVISRLADLIIPRDTTPGALDAGVPEYVDLQTSQMPPVQTLLSGGVQWLDRYCQERFGKAFLDCDEAQQKQVLDRLAEGKNVPPELRAARAFFVQVRDLTCDGFYSSKQGFQELGYKGNTFVGEWRGCEHPEHGA